MRVALTGSSGLIGNALAARLAPAHDIVHLGRHSSCDIRLDLAVPETLRDLDLQGCDALVHCAGVIDEDFRSDAAAAFAQATIGTRLLVEQALSSGVKLAVNVSTSHVYGPPHGIQDEFTPPAPTTDYAIAHYASERFFVRSADEMAVMVLRPNAVFGFPRSLVTFRRWNLIPFSFPAEGLYKGEIALRSSGEQHRNFVSTDDLADDVSEFLVGGHGPGLRIVNPVGADSLTVHAFALRCAEVVERLTGNPCPVRRPPSAPPEPGLDFAYSTRWPAPRPRRGVDDYLVAFTTQLVEESRHGRRYGT